MEVFVLRLYALVTSGTYKIYLVDLLTYIVTLLLFSHLEEDPLYIAYADMMAKVDRPLNHFFAHKTCCKDSCI